MSKSEQAKYKLQNPKDQKLTKTDFAKICNSWQEYPHHVSMGAQKNFTKFADYIVDVWEKNESSFNELYFRQTIALAIMFNYIDKMVYKQSWYEKGYKANIITYSMALLHFLVNEQFLNKVLNLKLIWDRQKLPEELEFELVKIAKFVFEYITDSSRAITNVTEWCKKEQCWITLRSKRYILNSNIINCLIDISEEKSEVKESKKDQKMVNGIEAQKEVVSYGQEYWEKLLYWGKSKKILSDIDISFILAATKINFGRIPTEKQSQRILNIRNIILEEGFTI